MKNFFLLFGLVITLFANAQTEKKLRQHRLNVEASKLGHTSIVSMDTFFCNGLKYAVVSEQNTDAKDIAPEYYFKDLKTGDTMIKVRLMSAVLNNEISNYYNYYFPALKSDCDVMVKEGQPDVPETVCKLQLLKQAGLDTFKAETWVTLKGNVKKIIARNQDVANNFKMVERDRSAKFIVKGNDIYQNNIIIGSFDESTVKDPMGGFQNHIEVFNTQRQMVSFSTETAAMSHEWRTVTNKDSKYHLIKSGPLKDEDIFYMIIFLIDNLYL